MRHMRIQRILSALLVLGGCGLSAAGGETPAARDGALQVDTAASRAYIKVGSTTRLGHPHGVVGQLSAGSVTLGGSGELEFDMRSFVADRPEARNYVGLTGSVSASDAQKTTGTMQGKDVLNVAKFPIARYVFRSATPLDGQSAGAPGNYRLDGDFTLHGVARPLPLTATVEKTDTLGVLRMRCGFAILQSQYGMKPYSAVGGLVGVEDKLEIWGDLIVRQAAPAAASAPAPSRSR